MGKKKRDSDIIKERIEPWQPFPDRRVSLTDSDTATGLKGGAQFLYNFYLIEMGL